MAQDNTIYADGQPIDVGNPIDNQTVFANGELVEDGGQSSTIFLNDRGIGPGIIPGAITASTEKVRILGTEPPFRVFDDYSHDGNVADVAWSTSAVDQEFAASTSDTTVKVYSTVEEQVVFSFSGGSPFARCVAFSNGLLFSGWDDNKVYVHDATSDFQLVDTLQQATDNVNACAANEDYVFYGDRNGRLFKHSLPGLSFVNDVDAESNIFVMDASPTYVATGSAGAASTYRASDLIETANQSTDGVGVLNFCAITDKWHIISPRDTDTLFLYDAGTSTERSINDQHSASAGDVNGEYIGYANGSDFSAHDAADRSLVTTESVSVDELAWRKP